MINADLSSKSFTPTHWRLHPAYLSEGGSNFELVHILLGRFLSEHHNVAYIAQQLRTVAHEV